MFGIEKSHLIRCWVRHYMQYWLPHITLQTCHQVFLILILFMILVVRLLAVEQVKFVCDAMFCHTINVDLENIALNDISRWTGKMQWIVCDTINVDFETLHNIALKAWNANIPILWYQSWNKQNLFLSNVLWINVYFKTLQ